MEGLSPSNPFYNMSRPTNPEVGNPLESHCTFERTGHVSAGTASDLDSELSFNFFREPPRAFRDPESTSADTPPIFGAYRSIFGGHGALTTGASAHSCEHGPAPMVESRPDFNDRFPINPPLTRQTDPVDVFRDLAEALKAFAPRRENREPISILFSGLPFECPRRFINSLEREFRLRETSEEEKIFLFAKQLRGEARSWFRMYENISLPFIHLKSRFLEQFDNSVIKSQLMAELYGKKQLHNQVVGVFIAEQCALARRLCPFMSDEEITRIILLGIRPELRAYLILKDFQTPEDLNRAATEIERTLPNPRRTTIVNSNPSRPIIRETNPFRQAPREDNTRVSNPPNRENTRANELTNKQPIYRPPQLRGDDRGVNRNQPRPDYSCYRCGGNHFIRDCPKPPPEKAVKKPEGQEAKPGTSKQNF